MKAPRFAYARAATLRHALELLSEAGEDGKILAGGQSLVPLMAFRLARPSHLIDIGRLEGLDQVRRQDGGLEVGALVRHAQLAARTDLDGPWAALPEAAGLIGHHPIRVRGTFGGSLAHADPAAELPTAVSALDGRLVVESQRGRREMAARDFFVGPLWTALEPDEIVVGGRFPAPPAD